MYLPMYVCMYVDLIQTAGVYLEWSVICGREEGGLTKGAGDIASLFVKSQIYFSSFCAALYLLFYWLLTCIVLLVALYTPF